MGARIPMIVWLRSLLFLIAWAAWTVALGALGLPLLLSRRAVHGLAWVWASGTLLLLRILCGLRSAVQGREHLPQQGGLVAAKHQSTWDTLVLWRELKNPVFVLKRQLYLIPVFGWYLWRSGQVAINRRDRRSTLRQVIHGAEWARTQRRTLVIFPEGTRVKPGTNPLFHRGIARVSGALKQPVVAVALNAGRFWPKLSLRKWPGQAVLSAMPPFAACGTDLSHWLYQLQRQINEETKRIGG